jgi:hypothetical protein
MGCASQANPDWPHICSHVDRYLMPIVGSRCDKEGNRMTTATGIVELGSRSRFEDASSANEANSSGVSWAAVTGGAFIAAALSLILLALGAGLGLSSVSPWSNVGASASTLGRAGVLWLIAMQIISSAMGGYLAGRLRTKWATIHTDEVHFRDTVHGLLVWSVGLVITATFLTSAATSMVGGSHSVSGPSGATELAASEPNAYFVDALFRSDRQVPYDNAAHLEAGRILGTALGSKEMSTNDRMYLTQMLAVRTGLSPSDADKRVSDVVGDARQTIEVARKAAAHLLLWLFIALLTGAFCASFAATIGGKQRDHVQTF